MSPAADPRVSHQRFGADQSEVFHAALETVRSLPGWEVLTAHPEIGEIRARSRGRIFSPTMDHTLRILDGDDGTDLEMESAAARQAGRVDEKTLDLFRVLLEDRLSRGRITIQ